MAVLLQYTLIRIYQRRYGGQVGQYIRLWKQLRQYRPMWPVPLLKQQ